MAAITSWPALERSVFEACAVIKPDSPIRAHVQNPSARIRGAKILSCMKDRFAFSTRLHYGKPVPVSANGRYRSLFFVHPETGLLLPSPRLSKRCLARSRSEATATIRWIRRGVGTQQIRGGWFGVILKWSVDIRFELTITRWSKWSLGHIDQARQSAASAH